MAWARTQRGAKRRVNMKHALRYRGFKVKGDITNKKLECMYRRYVGKSPPSY